MITFRMSHHHVFGYEIIEVIGSDGQFLASILPISETSIAIMSAHLLGACENDVRSFIAVDHGTWDIPVPSVELTFNPGPYRFEKGQIVRVERSTDPKNPLAQSGESQ